MKFKSIEEGEQCPYVERVFDCPLLYLARADEREKMKIWLDKWIKQGKDLSELIEYVQELK